MDNLKEEIKKAYEVWQSTNQNEEEREKAERRYMNLLSIEDNRQYERSLGRKEGKKEGKIEGKTEEKLETAKKMLELGLDIDTIEKVTGLDRKKIESLKK